MAADGKGAAAQLSETETCSRFIAAVSAREMPDNHNVQLCVLSVGFDVEGVVAELLRQRQRQLSRRVYCVVVPENLPPGNATRLATAIERHLLKIERETDNHERGALTAGAEAGEHASSPAASSPSSSSSVVAIEEGTGTKERCAVFQRGAVVLLTSRSLCADLLHRRLAVELVGMAILLLPHSLLGGARVQDALAPQTAFCVELLLRSSRVNSAGLTNTPRHAPPPIVVLSDAPMLMQSLVQRHHLGAERFTQQLHVGDIQLFPRFRLDFVRHFEELSRRDSRRGCPLDVDRVVAPVSPSVLALDGLLAKIALETLQELQRLEQQQQRSVERSGFSSGIGFANNSSSSSGGGDASCSRGWSPAARRAAAAADADEDVGAQRFLPRARLTATTVNGHLDYSGYPRRAASADPNSAAAGGGGGTATGSSYVRQGWRVAKDGKGIWYGGISEAAALSVDFSDLDSDLRAVVRRHEPQWPFRLLTESLIDVRRLRRATRGTAFSFLLHLESVLEKRLPQRSVYGTGARPPAALWTLSSHFSDVVTVATNRIGTVVYTRVPTNANTATTTTNNKYNINDGDTAALKSASSSVVVIDSDSSSSSSGSSSSSKNEGEAKDGVGQNASIVEAATATVSVPQLVPNTEEQETDVEVVVRLVMSWCRTILRRRAARKANIAAAAAVASVVDVDANSTGNFTPAVPRCPTLLLLTFGAGAVVRYTERLTHDRDAYQRLQLCRFTEMYQAKYGVRLPAYAPASTANAEGTPPPPPPAPANNTNAKVKREDEVASELAQVEQRLKTALLETDNPDDAYSEAEEAESEAETGSAGADAGDGGEDVKGALVGVSRRLLQPRDQSRKTRSTCVDPSVLYGESGAAAGAFREALLSQVPPLATQQQQQQESATLSADAVRDTVRADKDERVNSDAGHASMTTGVTSVTAVTPSTTPLLLCVERVRAGAVTLQPLLAASDEAVPSQDGVPRVLILDGTQLSATELTMLLDGTHAALAFSVPPVPDKAAATTKPAAPFLEGPASTATTAPTGARLTDDAHLTVERVILSRQQLSVLRQLEMAQDELPATCLRGLKVQLITTSLAEVDFKKEVQAEQVAFESLAHTKATLTGTLLVDQSSLRQTEEALESGLQVARRRGVARRGTAVGRLGGRFLTDSGAGSYAAVAPPCVIFDEREFRSTLPYELYKRGVDLVPLTLTTADYVLSPEYAVERKSMLDYFQSVMSGRIQHQLAALSRRYAHPICLIEFHRGIPFRLLQYRIYSRTAKLMANYPRVCFVWARSPAHAAGMLVTLKKSVATTNADPSDPSLTGSSMDPSSAGEASGLAASAAERETAHYAARVLSRFPGITHQNAPRVMQLCGSLIGLATISQASLATAMGEEDAARLYHFLHTPFHERVD